MDTLGHCEMDRERRMENRNYVIYVISNVFDSDIYIGCTSNTITQRLCQHVCNSKKTDTRLARKIRDIGRENLKIIDLYSRWMTQKDAQIVEGKLIGVLEPTLNAKSSGKYYDEDGNWDRVSYMREYRKEYRSKNKDKLSERTECECGGSYTLSHKARHLKTNRHLSSVSVFSSAPSSPPPLINPDDDPECRSE